MNNLVPLPYNRVAVQHASFELDDAHLHAFLASEQVWFETGPRGGEVSPRRDVAALQLASA